MIGEHKDFHWDDLIIEDKRKRWKNWLNSVVLLKKKKKIENA